MDLKEFRNKVDDYRRRLRKRQKEALNIGDRRTYINLANELKGISFVLQKLKKINKLFEV